ncbi:MAG: sugar ABC transporter permease [Clostridia bacterium]|jgi:lactose/L-arabinose transport system permease protein|nr:sugar ABC transporter permease [Clostridia bacterium]
MTTYNASKKRGGLDRITARKGWLFIMPAVILILVMSFYPMIQAFTLSLQTGTGNNLKFGGIANYQRLPKDNTYTTALGNTFFYLIIQVPIMLILALILASLLNDKRLMGRGIYRTLIFLPCATSLVSCSMIFLQLFSNNGLINTLLINWGWLKEPIPFLTDAAYARTVIIITMLWRWTGYNMVFYLAGLQNIDTQVYEAARIDGASAVQQFFRITLPLLRPIILFTTVLSTNGTLQLFDEVRIMTAGGPGIGTASLSFYIYRLTFEQVPRFGYAASMAFTIFVMVAALAFLQMKVGEQRK